MKIGLLGGTFDPVHKGHMNLIKNAQDEYEFDQIWMIPNFIPWMKMDRNITSVEARLEMLKLMTKNERNIKIYDYEIKQQSLSYTYHTVSHLTNEYPEHTFYFIVGADSFLNIDAWKYPEVIFHGVNILVALRNETNMSEIIEKSAFYQKLYKNCSIQYVHMDAYKMSSTEIRNISDIELLKDAVGIDVASYIDKNNLYKFGENDD